MVGSAPGRWTFLFLLGRESAGLGLRTLAGFRVWGLGLWSSGGIEGVPGLRTHGTYGFIGLSFRI